MWDKERKSKYRDLHKEEISRKAKAYRKKHHSLVRLQETRSRQNNCENYSLSQYKYYSSSLCKQTRSSYRKRPCVRSMLRIYKQNYRARKKSVGGVCSKNDLASLLASARCKKCNADHDTVIDHIIPVKLGGSGNIQNLQILCRRCNSKKSARLIEEFITAEVACDYINMYRNKQMNGLVASVLKRMGFL